MNPKFFRNGIVMLALVVVALAVAITLVWADDTRLPPMAYSVFLDEVEGGQGHIRSSRRLEAHVKPRTGAEYTVIVPGLLATQGRARTWEGGRQGGARDRLWAKQAPDTSWLGIIITGLLPILDHRRIHLLHDETGSGHE